MLNDFCTRASLFEAQFTKCRISTALRERKNNPARAPYEPAWPDQKTDRQNVTFYVKQY